MTLRLFALLFCLLYQPVLQAAETVYSFGVVPQFEARKLANIWMPIIDELEERTGLKMKMVGSPRIPDFEKSFIVGEFDFAYMNPYHLIIAKKAQGYIPLVRDHGRQLFGILTVLADSNIKEVSELEGQTVAFPAPNALGASLLMRADLDNLLGVSVVPKYVQTHSSAYLNVVLDQTAAAGGVMSTLKRQPAAVRDKLRIIYETRRSNPHPLSAHPRVPTAHREAVQQALLEIAQTENGKKLLAQIPMLDAGPATLEDYLQLEEWGLENYYVE